jgi:hypothetical protein
MTRTRALFLSVLAAMFIVGCGNARLIDGPEIDEAIQSASALASTLIWQVNTQETPYPCGDQCFPRVDCGCLPNKCADRGAAEGLPCSTLGDTCNYFTTNSTDSVELECEPAPVPPPPTLRWVADPEIDQCQDLCWPSTTCSCIRSHCQGGDVTDQPCTAQGSSCRVVSGADTWIVRCKLQ